MTARIRALVHRDTRRSVDSCCTWITLAWIEDPDEPDRTSCTRMVYRPSWPEAMQEAQVLRAELDRLLMDEMHASLAARRTERAAQLAAETTTKRRQPVVIGPEMEPTA
ncbi:hypothetical protein [Leucobacter iarius]|uniref:Uncharacterized protein n=1 Tax=Leucobacter iarius TaxID=333963 RepID=A0ABP4XTH1_9MICO